MWFNIAIMAEPVDAVARTMDPEKLAAIPPSFYDYVQQNPGTLPDYGPFAQRVFDVIAANPDYLVILNGPRGIGKTTQLIPALLKEGEQHGYQPLGSVFSLPYHGKEETHLDPHEWHIRDVGLNSWDINHRRPYWYESGVPSDLEEIIKSRFEDSGEQSLFIVDEAVAAMSGMADVIKMVLREAENSGVTLAITQPDAKDMDGGEREQQERDLTRLGRMAAKPLIQVKIDVTYVPQAEVVKMFETLGIDVGLAPKFEDNHLLRTLRAVEHIFHRTSIVRTRNNLILGADHIRQALRYPGIGDLLGLSYSELEHLKSKFSDA